MDREKFLKEQIEGVRKSLEGSNKIEVSAGFIITTNIHEKLSDDAKKEIESVFREVVSKHAKIAESDFFASFNESDDYEE